MRASVMLAALWATTAAAQDTALVPLSDLSEAEFTWTLALERCSGFYRAMETRGLETGVDPSVLELVVQQGEISGVMALQQVEAGEQEASRQRQAAYEASYLADFRKTGTEINMISSPNPLFQSDRAVCFEVVKAVRP